MCWAFRRAKPAPGLERSKAGPLVAWKEAPGGAAVGPAGPGPPRASPTECPFPASLGPAAKLGAARWPALRPRLRGKWPQRRLPPAPPGGSGLQTPPPGAWSAPRPAWGQSSRRAGGRQGPWGPRAGGWRPSRKPRGPSPGSQPPASVLLEKRGTNETVFSFLFRDSRSWNLHPLGFAIFTHPEPSGLHGDASKQQIPGGNDVTFPFPAAQASRRCRHAGPPG